eukprot:gene3374-3834_t
MLLYNVTLIVEDASAQEWLEWMKTVHIPKVMATGRFVSNRLLAVLDSPNEGQTFCSQYVVESMEHYLNYQQLDAPALQEELNTRP